MQDIILKNALVELGLPQDEVASAINDFKEVHMKDQWNKEYDCLDSDDCNCPECGEYLLAHMIGEARAMFGDNVPDAFDLLYSRVEHYGKTHITNFNLDRFTDQVNSADVNYKIRNGKA
jgi:hypothetical protein